MGWAAFGLRMVLLCQAVVVGNMFLRSPASPVSRHCGDWRTRIQCPAVVRRREPASPTVLGVDAHNSGLVAVHCAQW